MYTIYTLQQDDWLKWPTPFKDKGEGKKQKQTKKQKKQTTKLDKTEF